MSTSTPAFFTSLRSNLSLQDTYYSPLSLPYAIPSTHLHHNSDGRPLHYTLSHDKYIDHDTSFAAFTFPAHANTRQSFHPRSWSSSSSSIHSTSSPSPTTNSHSSDSEDEYITYVPAIAPTPHLRLARTSAEKQQALRLLASSVKQQGNMASYALLSHPSTILLLFCALLTTLRWCWNAMKDVRKPILSCIALLLAVLIVARLIGLGYSSFAGVIEQNDWLAAEDEILVARIIKTTRKDVSREVYESLLGNRLERTISANKSEKLWARNDDNHEDNEVNTTVLGVLILRYHAHEGKLSKKGKRVGRGWIRGWAVHPSHTKQGIGTSLLLQATKLVSSRGGDRVYFAADHAHSKHILPRFYNSIFRKRDERARVQLDTLTMGRRGSGSSGGAAAGNSRLGGRSRSW